jgi:hypothetical protein
MSSPLKDLTYLSDLKMLAYLFIPLKKPTIKQHCIPIFFLPVAAWNLPLLILRLMVLQLYIINDFGIGN